LKKKKTEFQDFPKYDFLGELEKYLGYKKPKRKLKKDKQGDSINEQD